MNFLFANWYNFPLCYLGLVILTTIFKVASFQKGEVHYKENGSIPPRFGNKIFKFNWSDAPLHSTTPLLFMLVPFLNIYWRYCIFNVCLESLKIKLERDHRSMSSYLEIEVSRGWNNDLSFEHLITDEVEQKAINRVKECFAESIYFLPIALLLVTFLIAGKDL